MAKKIALALSGGGMHGAFQVGALEYIRANWNKINPNTAPLTFDVIAGVSAGALNGSMLAVGKFDPLIELWDKVGANVEEIYTSDFIDTKAKGDKVALKKDPEFIMQRFLPKTNPLNNKFKTLWGFAFGKKKLMQRISDDMKESLRTFRSIADNTPLKKKLHALLRKDEVKTIFRCGSVSLNSGNYSSVRSNDFQTDADFANAVLASASLPVVWQPVPEIKCVGGTIKNSVDGGVINSSPLGDVIDEIEMDEACKDEYFILIINCHNGTNKEGDHGESNVMSIAVRSIIDIMMAEIFNNDLKEFIRTNEMLEQVAAIDPNARIYKDKQKTRQLKHFSYAVIQPAHEGDLGDPIVATPGWIKTRKELGWKRAEDVLSATGVVGPLIV